MHLCGTQARELERLDKSLEGFLAKWTMGLGRPERRRWAGVYVRGLLLDGERKSIEPMASRLGESDQDLQHCVRQRPWSADLLLEGLAKATASAVPAYGIIDETSFPKAGQFSAGGGQRQDGGALGKTANCQLAVSLHRADAAAGTSQPLGWRLFLPESWTDDPARCPRAGIPPGSVHQGQLDLALGLIEPALGWKSPVGVVLADEADGGSFEWRLALRERALFDLRARAVDDHRLAASTALRAPRSGAPGLLGAAWAAAQPRTEAPAKRRTKPARFGVEEGHLAAGHEGAATLAFCRVESVGSPRLETRSTAWAGRGSRAHRVAAGPTRAHPLLAGVPA